MQSHAQRTVQELGRPLNAQVVGIEADGPGTACVEVEHAPDVDDQAEVDDAQADEQQHQYVHCKQER